MSMKRNNWIGIGVASLIALVLAASEIVDKPNDWQPADLARLEASAGASEYATASAGPVSATLGETQDEVVSKLEREGLDLQAASVPVVPAAAPSAGQPVAPVHAVSALRVNSEGHFVPSPIAAQLFDSYYAAYPDASDDVVRGRIVIALYDGLSPRAADEAISVLDRWRAARTAELELGSGASVSDRDEVRKEALGDHLSAALTP